MTSAGSGTSRQSFTGLVPYTPYALITCLDGKHPVGFDAWQESAASLVERSPRFGAVLANELLPCAWWPEGTYAPHVVAAAGTPPILVIGSTGDAATPYDVRGERGRQPRVGRSC